ncbi:WUSCHEL-related homeobox 11-like [Curcuma longa]|uniref:WUSCHEL-related homeobox 11-like n=1 Tax=Curcuma longa TaxID=136217 RepID=UPI003D9F45C9
MDSNYRPNITSMTNHSVLPPPPAPAPAEHVRTRWMPKPEQILILESIFDSGVVNPSKDETVRIRKLLEKFGALGDANVFYWFQNRRSRSRRQQRQLQASLAMQQAAGGSSSHLIGQPPSLPSSLTTGGSGAGGLGFFPCSSSSDDLFAISRQMGFTEATDQNLATTFMSSSDHATELQCQTGTVTVFIDGVPSEVPRGLIDLRATFGSNVMVVHSSGQILPVDEHGILMRSFQTGESYFLVKFSEFHK